MTKKYREYISDLPCCITGRDGPNDPHHIIGSNWLTGKSMGKKASDLTCIPLTHELHHEIHQRGWSEFEKLHNVSQVEMMVKTILQAEKDGMIVLK